MADNRSIEDTEMCNEYEIQVETEKRVDIDNLKDVFNEVVNILLEKLKNVHPSDAHSVAAELRAWCKMYYGKLGDE